MPFEIISQSKVALRPGAYPVELSILSKSILASNVSRNAIQQLMWRQIAYLNQVGNLHKSTLAFNDCFNWKFPAKLLIMWRSPHLELVSCFMKSKSFSKFLPFPYVNNSDIAASWVKNFKYIRIGFQRSARSKGPLAKKLLLQQSTYFDV